MSEIDTCTSSQYCSINYCRKALRVLPMFVVRSVSYSQCKQKMMSFRRQASSAKMTSFGGKLIELACLPTKRVNKAEGLTLLSTNFGFYARKCVIVALVLGHRGLKGASVLLHANAYTCKIVCRI
jgi:hypothetical protein